MEGRHPSVELAQIEELGDDTGPRLGFADRLGEGNGGHPNEPVADERASIITDEP